MRYLAGRILLAIGLTVTSIQAQQPAGSVAFDNGWQLRGDSVRVEQFDGRTTLAMKNGFAYRRDVRLENGTIDVDVMSTEMRSFVYVMFRMQTDSTFEDFYMRPHKSNAPDALQYAPVYQQSSAWQLYHGATGTAAVNIPDGVWNRLRIVVSGRSAAIFLNDTVKPAMIVPRLGHEPRAGYLALRAFLPPGVPGTGPTVRFANLRVRPGHVPFAFPTADPSLSLGMTSTAGVVRSWQVGDAFAVGGDSAIVSAPTVTKWNRVEALPNGLVELHRVVPLAAGMRNVGVVARLNIVADRAGVYPMELGFSDRVTAIVNGTPLFHGNDSYDYANRRDGLIGFSQATLYLPLRAGANTVDFIVTDVFGGWGIMGRFPSMDGLRID
jgi:hypothetical protein